MDERRLHEHRTVPIGQPRRRMRVPERVVPRHARAAVREAARDDVHVDVGVVIRIAAHRQTAGRQTFRQRVFDRVVAEAACRGVGAEVLNQQAEALEADELGARPLIERVARGLPRRLSGARPRRRVGAGRTAGDRGCRRRADAGFVHARRFVAHAAFQKLHLDRKPLRGVGC